MKSIFAAALCVTLLGATVSISQESDFVEAGESDPRIDFGFGAQDEDEEVESLPGLEADEEEIDIELPNPREEEHDKLSATEEAIWKDAERKFEHRQETMRQQLERLRARLDNLDERIGTQDDNREAIIKEYVRRMMATKQRSENDTWLNNPEPNASDQLPKDRLSRKDSPHTKLLMLEIKQAELKHRRAKAEQKRLQSLVEKRAASTAQLRDAKYDTDRAYLEIGKAMLKLEISKSQPSANELIDLYEAHPRYANLSAQIEEYEDYIGQMSNQLRSGSPQLKEHIAELSRLRAARKKLEAELRPRMIERIRATAGELPREREGRIFPQRTLGELDPLDPALE